MSSRVTSLSDPADDAYVVVPDDDVDLPSGTARGLWVVTTGDVSFVTVHGTQVDLTGVAANAHIPVRARRVLETTSATILALV